MALPVRASTPIAARDERPDDQRWMALAFDAAEAALARGDCPFGARRERRLRTVTAVPSRHG